MDLKELSSGVDPATHWYYQTKIIPLRRYFLQLVRRDQSPWNCVDIGAGSGFFSESLLREFPDAIRQVVLVDTGYSAAELATGGRVVRQREMPERMEHCLVMLMDVLEHLPDELVLLRELRARSQGGNHFFITVPAFQSVWSNHDLVLGHYRRYTRDSLREILIKTGFQVERVYYIYRMIFPLVWMYRKWPRSQVQSSDMKPIHPVLNALLRRMNAIEIRLDRVNYQFGLTCVAEGRV